MRRLLSWILALVLMSSAMVGPIKIALAPTDEPDGSEPWAMFRHDPRHTGFSNSTAPDRLNVTAGLMWTGETGLIGYSSCAVANGTVFVGSRDGWIYAFNEKSGNLTWKSQNKIGQIYSSPAVSNGKVFIGSLDGKIYALDAITGDFIGNLTIGLDVYSSPAVADGMVFVGSDNATVYALDENLEVKWKNYTTGSIYSSPAVADGMVFVGCLDRKVYAFNETDGHRVWANETDGQIKYSSPAVDDGKVFIGDRDGWIYAFDEANGHRKWKNETGDKIESSPAVAYGRVFIGSEDNKIYAFNETTGHPLWSYETGGDVHSSPAVANGKVFVASHDGYLYALNATTGDPIWKCETDGEIDSSPAVADGMVFVGSNKVYAFGPNNPPIADFDYEPKEPKVNQTMTFDASNSSDPDETDEIVDYTWDFGDGNITSSETNPIIDHTYRDGGNYTVALTVKDSHGATNRNSTTVWVRMSKVVVTKVEPESYSVTMGKTVNINVTVENQGDFNETNRSITAYWSNETDTGEIGTQHVNLTIGESKDLVFPWDTSTVARGNYSISANGTLDDKVLVGLHDLAVTNVTATPTEVLYDSVENVSVFVTVANLGDFTEHFNMTVYWTNATMEREIGNRTNESLPPSDPEIFPFSWSTAGLAVGNYTINANVTVVDDDINPDNNNFTNGDVRVREPEYDISVTDVHSLDKYVAQGNITMISVTVCNIGDKDLTDVPVTVYWANETTGIIGVKNVSLAIGECDKRLPLFKWNTTDFSGGLYTIRAFANLTGDPTPENNYRDADDPVSIYIPAHDVEVVKVWPSKHQVYAILEVSFYVNVRNNGNYTESFIVEVYANTTVISSDKTEPLGRGSSCTLTFDWIPGWPYPTVYNITAVANLTDPAVTDPTPENNSGNCTLTVLEPIDDVAIIELRCPEPPVYNGTRRNIDVTVQNQGAYPEDATLILYANNTQIWNTTDLELEPGNQTITVPATWDVPGFPDKAIYIIEATIIIAIDDDPGDNYANCTATVEPAKWHDVAVIGDPILTYKNYKYAFYLSPTHPERVQLTMNVSVKITNLGHFNEEVNVTVFLRLAHGLHNDTDPVGNKTFISLAPEETRTVTIPCCIWNNSDIERDIRKLSPPGNASYWIMARASIPFDNDTSNNINPQPSLAEYKHIFVTIPTDITGLYDRADGEVDMRDVASVARGFGAYTGDPEYYLRLDIRGDDPYVPDGRIDMKDVATVARHYGKTYPPS